MPQTTTVKPLSAISLETIQAHVRTIPDFPKPGIQFRDITTVLREPSIFADIIDYMYHQVQGVEVDYVSGIESRGFILGSALAYSLKAGFVPIRKKGKLPGPVERFEYALEYGTDCVEIHKDAIEPGSKVLLVDDLLATGGTAAASAALLEKINTTVVGVQFLIELVDLDGRSKLDHLPNVHAMLRY